MLIDTGNSANVWALEVGWAELRLGDVVLPIAMIHGITSSGDAMDSMRLYYENSYPPLNGRIINPSVTRNGSIRANVNLMEQPIADLLARSGADNVNLLGHSFGGLDSRLYGWDHPSRVKRLMMIGTPNGGSRLADILCGNRKVPFLLKGALQHALDVLSRQFGRCDGPENGLYQLQQSYVQDVFNKQVPDRYGTRYFTIAGQGTARLNLLLDGEDDGAVTVASVRYLRPNLAIDPNPNHPGLHIPLYPALEKAHGPLIEESSPAMRMSLCRLYPVADAECGGVNRDSSPAGGGAAAFSAASASSGGGEAISGEGQVIPALGVAEIPLSFEGASNAVVTIFADQTADISPQLVGADFKEETVFDVPVLSAALASPSDGTLRIANKGSQPATVYALTVVETDRNLTVDATPNLFEPGAPVTLTAQVASPLPGDAVTATVSDASGATVTELDLTATGGGAWATSFVPPAPGSYSVAAWIEGAKPRFDADVFSVSSGNATIAGSFTEQAEDQDGDGLIDALRVSPALNIAAAGPYRIAGRLVDASGRSVATAGVTGTLGVGAQSLTMRFEGRDIFTSRAAGPYRLVDVVLSKDDPTMALEDQASDLGATGTYDYVSFEHFPVEIDLDGFSDEGVDANGDGRIEALRVTGSAWVEQAGAYTISARLVATDGTPADTYETEVILATGDNNITLEFADGTIATSGPQGSYLVEDLTIASTSAAAAYGYLPLAHQTTYYGEKPMTFEGLRVLLDDLKQAGEVDDKSHMTLGATLDGAEQSYDAGLVAAAREQLEAFRRELELHHATAGITANAYQRLDQAARSLRESL